MQLVAVCTVLPVTSEDTVERDHGNNELRERHKRIQNTVNAEKPHIAWLFVNFTPAVCVCKKGKKRNLANCTCRVISSKLGLVQSLRRR